MKHSGLFAVLLVFLSSIAFAELSSVPEIRDSWWSPSVSASGKSAVAVIAQRGMGEGDRIMAAKCREWEQNKNAAPRLRPGPASTEDQLHRRRRTRL